MSKTKEWTLMFYMASDNPLAISIVSQLKALKDAGFHHQANVIAQFDPFTEGTPTHVFDVNLINKLKYDEPNIGFDGSDSFVRNLIEDKLWRDEMDRDDKKKIRECLDHVMFKNHGVHYVAPMAPNPNGNSRFMNGDGTAETDGVPKRVHGRRRHEPSPYVSLRTFLDFCQSRYPARHYMLFIVGHGVVVGNDIFLHDEHAEEQSITLTQMGKALREFKTAINQQEATFELVSFHSCSVSSLEVAYELKGTANYMLASQGPTFVGSWPYRQILVRIFKEIQRNGKKGDIKELLSDIYHYCLFNSADYLLAGYSYQLTLCDLRKIGEIREPMESLSTALKKGVTDPATRFVILYAHWKAQSFFQEMYTDLYDFCLCIEDRCKRIIEGGGRLTKQLAAVRSACRGVIEVLRKSDNKSSEEPDNSVVVHADFAGPAYQYSHGFSVYFPWSRPSEDSQIMQEYEGYRFNQRCKSSWADFLNEYFEETQRDTRSEELSREQGNGVPVQQSDEHKIQEDIGSLIYNGEGPLGGSLAKSDASDKQGGGDCECSFKNYPRDTRARGERRKKAKAMPVSETLLGNF